jgi:hypothetical protein
MDYLKRKVLILTATIALSTGANAVAAPSGQDHSYLPPQASHERTPQRKAKKPVHRAQRNKEVRHSRHAHIKQARYRRGTSCYCRGSFRKDITPEDVVLFLPNLLFRILK